MDRPVEVFMVDASGCIHSASCEASVLFQRPAAHLVGERLASLWPVATRDSVARCTASVLAGERYAVEVEPPCGVPASGTLSIVRSPLVREPGLSDLIVFPTRGLSHGAGEIGDVHAESFLGLALRLARDVLRAPPGSEREVIRDWMEVVGQTLGIDLVGLRWLDLPERKTAYVHAWSKDGSPWPPPLVLDQLPWACPRLLAGIPIAVRSLDELPAEAQTTRAHLERARVVSAATLPIRLEDDLWGLLHVATQAVEREWSADLLQGLRLLGEILALVHSRCLALGRNSALVEHFEGVVEDLGELVVRWKPDGTRLSVNAAYCQAFDLTREQALGTSFLPLVHPEDRSELQTRLSRIRPEKPVPKDVHRVLLPGGEVGWQSWTDRGIFDEDGELIEVQSIGRDVTDGVRTRLELDEALSELRRVRAQLEAENRFLKQRVRSVDTRSAIVGESAALKACTDLALRVAPTYATVLIEGETGTGKELIARLIHDESGREGPLVAVNCAALPPSLIESELFGHEAGAFTGATTLKRGRFELAHRGTLFLDEVGELSPEVQAKLLRVLQERQFERVGGTAAIPFHGRLLAATHRDLLALVQAGEFREDLYYRLHVLPIHVPSLRERREDIPILALHLARKHGPNVGRQVQRVSPELIRVLESGEWPGNVRELESYILRALMLGEGPVLELPGPLPSAAGSRAEPTSQQRLEDVEREHILRVLERVDWVVGGEHGAASVLGLPPSTLRSRMDKLGIRRPERAGPPMRQGTTPR